jgi:hypothetical protein
MITIHTLLYGDKYTYDDVNRIAASVPNMDCRFVCHTDQGEKLRKDGLYEDIILRWADIELGTFEKVNILGQDWGHSIYLDLDVVIQKQDLSDFITIHGNAICKTYWKPEGFEAEHKGGDFNSSVMSWRGISGLPIKKHFNKNPYKWIKEYDGCDDKYLFHEHKDKFHPYEKGKIYSYMFGIDHETDVSPRGRKYRSKPDICLLNGQDRFNFDLRTDYYTHFSNNKVG